MTLNADGYRFVLSRTPSMSSSSRDALPSEMIGATTSDVRPLVRVESRFANSSLRAKSMSGSASHGSGGGVDNGVQLSSGSGRFISQMKGSKGSSRLVSFSTSGATKEVCGDVVNMQVCCIATVCTGPPLQALLE